MTSWPSPRPAAGLALPRCPGAGPAGGCARGARQLLPQRLHLLLGLRRQLVRLALHPPGHLAVDVAGQRLAVAGHSALIALEVAQLLHELAGHPVLGPEALAAEVVGVLVQR